MIKKAFLTVMTVTAVLVLTSPFMSFGANSAPSAARPVAGYNLYFGDLHSHTTYSDGWEGTPLDAYLAAKAAGADFLATTDHAKWISPDEWATTLSMAAEVTSSTFAAIPAYEYWLEGGRGEINVYGLSYLPPAWTYFGNSPNRLANFYDWLAAQPGGSGQWNHPDYMTQTQYNDFGLYSKSRDVGMNLLEICNQGSYDWQGTTDWEASYIMALDNGWHVLPAANSDTHSPDWISGYEVRTVLLAPSLTPADLYAAMSASRGYATQDKNLRISYTLNGAVMGSTVSTQAKTYTASISIVDPDNVASDRVTMLELVSDGGAVVASKKVNSCSVDWTLTISTNTAHYFYLRVTTNSSITGGPGVTAWTAPVWTGR